MFGRRVPDTFRWNSDGVPRILFQFRIKAPVSPKTEQFVMFAKFRPDFINRKCPLRNFVVFENDKRVVLLNQRTSTLHYPQFCTFYIDKQEERLVHIEVFCI